MEGDIPEIVWSLLQCNEDRGRGVMWRLVGGCIRVEGCAWVNTGRTMRKVILHTAGRC